MADYPTQDQVIAVRMVEAMAQFIVLAQLASPETLDLVSGRLEQPREGPAEQEFLANARRFLGQMKEEHEG